MNNKVQGYILFGVKAVIILLGVLFTIWVMRGGDPAKMGDDEMEQLAIRDAKTQGLEETMSQGELEVWLSQRGPEIKEEQSKAQYDNVSVAIDFTVWVLYIVLFVVVVSFIYMFTVDMKKALFSLAGIVGILLFMVIIYYSVGDQVPEGLSAKEIAKGVAEQDRLFTPGNWRIASAAIMSTVILAVVALVGWLGGEVIKFFK